MSERPDSGATPPERPAGRAAGRRLLPDPRRALRDDAAGRPRRRGGQGRGPGRRRHPHLAAAGARRRLDVLPRRQPQQALDRPRPQGPGRRRPRPRSWPAGPTSLVENFRPGGLARFGLDYDTVAATNPRIVYASISGFGSGPEGAALPGYDLIVQAISGLMSLTGDPDGEPYRAGISVFDVMAGLHATIGILAALQPPARDRPRPARRGQPAVLGAVRPGQPDQRVRRRRRRPDPDGQQPPEPVPLRAAAVRRRRPDHHRRQQRPVPQAGRGARRARAGRRPALRPQRGPHRQPRRAAAAAGRAAAHPRRRTEWFRDIIAAGVPCGPINTIDGGVAFAEEVGLDPVVTVGEGDAAVPSVRNPITLLRDPGRLPAAAAGARRARRRDPPLAGRDRRSDRRSHR